MSSYNFDFSQLFKNTFGFNIGYAGSSIMDGQINAFEKQKLQPLPETKPLQLRSQSGVLVWDYVKLLPKMIEGTGEQFNGYQFPFEVVVDAILPKKIVTTEIFGRDGDVEELMAIGDWEINIRGFIINYDGPDYPEAQVRELTRVCSLKDTMLEVEGTYLNMLGIDNISIHRFTPRASPGYRNMQAFEIEARSKQPFNVDVDNGILL